MVHRGLDQGSLTTIDKAPKLVPVSMGHARKQCGESQHQTVAGSRNQCTRYAPSTTIIWREKGQDLRLTSSISFTFVFSFPYVVHMPVAARCRCFDNLSCQYIPLAVSQTWSALSCIPEPALYCPGGVNG